MDQTLGVSELFLLGFLVCFLLPVSVVIITECASSIKLWVTWDPEIVYRAQKMVSSSQLLSFVRHGKSDRYKNSQECLWLTGKEDLFLLSLNTRHAINKFLIYIWGTIFKSLHRTWPVTLFHLETSDIQII